MIAASFRVKDIHIDWRWGERYFAERLADYDPCVNNGNWQRAASTGCDVRPYCRIFNPWLQRQRFDPDCRYIRRWLPELKTVPAPVIHGWHKKQAEGAYPAPVADHEEEARRALERYRKCAAGWARPARPGLCCGFPCALKILP